MGRESDQWSLSRSKDCQPNRVIQIPKFAPLIGDCTLEAFRNGPVHGTVFCVAAGQVSPKLYPYTFSTRETEKHSTIGIYDDSRCSYYVQSKDGSRYESHAETLPTKGNVPVVVFHHCRILPRGTLHREKIGQAYDNKGTDDQALMIIDSQMQQGKTYWGVSVDEDRNVYGCPRVDPSYRGDKWVLQKSDKSFCRTYFVGECWYPVY
ncbi:hypothetical protein F4824DRAFT_484634 [Ustulina deusta]|nr:hypothetical protein F4824DRAFT_484634 [Ustulina deusta]